MESAVVWGYRGFGRYRHPLASLSVPSKAANEQEGESGAYCRLRLGNVVSGFPASNCVKHATNFRQMTLRHKLIGCIDPPFSALSVWAMSSSHSTVSVQMPVSALRPAD